MKKLPVINAQYWFLIIVATTLGETGADLISQSLNLGYGLATMVFLFLFIAVLTAELKTKIQHPALYWVVITLASLMGTTISDYVTRSLGLGYAFGVLLIASVLGIIFYIWRRGSYLISVQDAFDIKTEFLYWAAILTSSTLGTALGDYIADGTSLGFGGGALFLLLLLVMIALLVLLTRISRNLCYWLAIIVTHPMGATMGDFMTKAEGLDLGNMSATLVLLSLLGLGVLVSRMRQS